MAWKWCITSKDFQPGYRGVNVEVKIWKDTWPQKDRAILRQWSFSMNDAVTAEAIAGKVQNEIDEYEALKQKSSDINPLVGIEQTIA